VLLRTAAAAVAWLGVALIGVMPVAAEEQPRIAYWLHCAGCHGLEGRGAPPDVPTLVDVPGRIAALPGGREYLVRVPGVSQAALSDERLAAVVNYMLTEFSADSLQAGFIPYTAAEIGRNRANSLTDPLKTRHELLQAAGRESP